MDSDGFVTFPDGSRYKGKLIDGIPDGGQGKIIYKDESEYDGDWVKGSSHG